MNELLVEPHADGRRGTDMQDHIAIVGRLDKAQAVVRARRTRQRLGRKDSREVDYSVGVRPNAVPLEPLAFPALFLLGCRDRLVSGDWFSSGLHARLTSTG